MTATVVHSPLPLGRPVNVPPAVRRGAWQLKSGQAITLRAAGQSVLKVRQGRVWVTCGATDTWMLNMTLLLGLRTLAILALAAACCAAIVITSVDSPAAAPLNVGWMLHHG